MAEMKSTGSAVAAFVFLLFLLTDARENFVLREEPDDACDEVYNLVKDAIDVSGPWMIGQVQQYAQQYFKTNISNSGELKSFVCRAIGVKTLKDVYELGEIERVIPYEEGVQMYKRYQAFIGEYLGGYTNFERYVNTFKDVETWSKTLKAGATTPKEATSLEKLTQFFQVMQVKYGSRWMSVPAEVYNQRILIEDPVEMAERLYEAKSRDDVKEIMSVPVIVAYRIYYNVLVVSRNRPGSNIKRMAVFAKAVTKLGELGLFDLKY